MIKKLVACIAILGSTGAAYAADQLEGPKVAFDATYSSVGPAGASTLRMVSDGKGHVRNETVTNGQKFISIMDYPAKQAITLIDAQKMAMKTTLKPAAEVHDAESAKKNNAKSLGAKVVAGHPSHGWEYTVDGGKVETWVGDDIKYLVKSETTTPHGKITMELKTFSNAAPGPDQFKVPAGYKMMEVPGQ